LTVRSPNYKTFQPGEIFEVITNKADKVKVDIKMIDSLVKYNNQ